MLLQRHSVANASNSVCFVVRVSDRRVFFFVFAPNVQSSAKSAFSKEERNHLIGRIWVFLSAVFRVFDELRSLRRNSLRLSWNVIFFSKHTRQCVHLDVLQLFVKIKYHDNPGRYTIAHCIKASSLDLRSQAMLGPVSSWMGDSFRLSGVYCCWENCAS